MNSPIRNPIQSFLYNNSHAHAALILPAPLTTESSIINICKTPPGVGPWGLTVKAVAF